MSDSLESSSVVFTVGIRKVNREVIYDSSSEDSDSDGSCVFTCGKKRRYFVPESQFDFDNQDLVVARNVDGIGNIATFSIPETQMQDRSVNIILRK